MTQEERQAELNNCTFVKTMLMLFVVLYHCVVFWTGSWFTGAPAVQSSVLATLAGWLNSFHIYGFTLASGYLFYYLKYEKGKYSHFLPFLGQKAKRLLVPYAFAAVAWVIPITCLFIPFDLGEVIGKYVLGTAPGQLWFLLMLFGVFLLFYPLSSFLKARQVLGVVVVIGFFGIGLVGQSVLPNMFQLFQACMYLPIFWLGFKLRQWGSGWLRRIPTVLWVIAHVGLFAVGQHLARFTGTIFMMTRIGLNFAIHVVGALMAFSVLQALANKVRWKDSRVFGLLSKLSMPVYLFHQQVIYISIHFFNGLINPYIHAAVNFVIAMAVSLALSALMMKFRPTRILIGEK